MLLSRQLVREYSLAIGVVSCDVGRHVTPDREREKVFMAMCEIEMGLEDEVLSDKTFLFYLLIFRQLEYSTHFSWRTNNRPEDR